MSQPIKTLHDVLSAMQRGVDYPTAIKEYYTNKPTEYLEKELKTVRQMLESFAHLPQVVAQRKMCIELIEAELAMRKGGAADG